MRPLVRWLFVYAAFSQTAFVDAAFSQMAFKYAAFSQMAFFEMANMQGNPEFHPEKLLSRLCGCACCKLKI